MRRGSSKWGAVSFSGSARSSRSGCSFFREARREPYERESASTSSIIDRDMFPNCLLRSSPTHVRATASYIELSKVVRSAYCITTSSFYKHRLTTLPARKLRLYGGDAAKQVRSNGVEQFTRSLNFPAATQEIGDLERSAIAGAELVLHGYLGIRHDLSKKLSFVPLQSKDLNHSIQIVSSRSPTGDSSDAHSKLKQCKPRSPVAIRGRLKARNEAPTPDRGEILKVQSWEVELSDIQELNEFPPGIILDSDTVVGPDQRHLQIRQERNLRDALKFRSEVSKFCRGWLQDKEDFVEVETPLLFKSTPEGAREFLVPTRKKGMAYALPQSPQQFKQILINSGIPRYFQIARCFRDEDLRADRQPEFTQLDLEMSFATGEDVMRCTESLIKELWSVALKSPLPDTPFPRMTYHEAMSQYGTDKPDLRRGLCISRIDHLLPVDLVTKLSELEEPAIDCLHVKCGQVEQDPKATGKLVRDFFDSNEGSAYAENADGAPGVFVFDTTKPLSGLFAFGFEAAEKIERLCAPSHGDLILLQARRVSPFSGGSTVLGRLGIEIHNIAIQRKLINLPSESKPLWITDFPLFSPSTETEPGQGGAAGFSSTHHPFTSPKTPEDVALLDTNPLNAKADHYDLVMNGVELGGGSRRIHNAEMQRYVLRDILQLSPERLAEFSHLLEVLRAGCPPHAGIALGFDRLVAVMLGRQSVRDVIAFPKSGRGEDPLVKSPGPMSKEALEMYHLRLVN